MKNLYSILIVISFISTFNEIISQNPNHSNNINGIIENNSNIKKSDFYLIHSEKELKNLKTSTDLTKASIFEVNINATEIAIKPISKLDSKIIIIKLYTPLPEGTFIALMDQNDVVKQIIHKSHNSYERQFQIGILQNKSVLSKLPL